MLTAVCAGGGSMSVEPVTYFEATGARSWRTSDLCCFYCYRPLADPFVHWSGSTGHISLHPGCVVELTIRLYRDVHQTECGPHGYVTQRTLPELRARLMREERRQR